MNNIKLVIQYDGTDYNGFQIQPNGVTIQGCLESALQRLNQGNPIRIVGSGRTDAGVHAEGQVVSFRSTLSVPLSRLPLALNSILPRDIKVTTAEVVDSSFHARYSAVRKTYRYQIWNSNVPNVFMRKYALWFRGQLDKEAILQATKLLQGKHDFNCFAASGGSVKTTVRHLYAAELSLEGNLVVFRFTADGFLYNMVRNMVGTLLEIGCGKRDPGNIDALFKSGNRTLAGSTAAAHGLFLEKVEYP